MTYKVLDFLVLLPLAVAAAYDAARHGVPRAATRVLVWGGIAVYLWMLLAPGAPFRPLSGTEAWVRPLAAVAVAVLGYAASCWFGMADVKACFYIALAMRPLSAIIGFAMANVLVVLYVGIRAAVGRRVRGGRVAFLPFLLAGCVVATALAAP